jgi:probable F420-dependent oxidoreductase
MARAAEAAGFDSLWVGDHLLYRSESGASGPWEAWTELAALAAVTSTIRLGPLVAATSFHSPAMLAKKAATVAEIAEGRLILGLGAGWNEAEYQAYGFPFDHRASRFEEAFTIIRTLLRDGAIDFDGDYYKARDCVLFPTPRQGGPPIMIGSIGTRVLRATLPHVDMWNTWHAWYGNSVDGLAPMIAKVSEAARAAGRDPAEIEMTAAIMVEMPGGSGRRHGSPGRATSVAISGDPSEMAETISAYATAGVGHVQLVVDPITLDSITGLGAVLAILDAM